MQKQHGVKVMIECWNQGKAMQKKKNAEKYLKNAYSSVITQFFSVIQYCCSTDISNGQ